MKKKKMSKWRTKKKPDKHRKIKMRHPIRMSVMRNQDHRMLNQKSPSSRRSQRFRTHYKYQNHKFLRQLLPNKRVRQIKMAKWRMQYKVSRRELKKLHHSIFLQ
jgi:hypothetical protein